VDYAVERFGDDVKIVLSGVSMGGATVLEASRLELKPNVKCVIADSPFSSPEDIIRRVCSDTVFPPSFAMPFVKLGALVYGRLRLGGGAIEAVKESRLPILIIHGEADYYVPTEMGKKVYEACTSKKRLLLVPDAGHGISFIVDGELYVSTVKEFLNEVL
jgi:fermentation-respiration switch protein FrsA (DUF1100 family)